MSDVGSPLLSASGPQKRSVGKRIAETIVGFPTLIGDSMAEMLSINQSTLSGAIDIIVVPQKDGSLKSSPFQIRFGKFQVMKAHEKIVTIVVNDEPVDVTMRLGYSGEAYFIDESSYLDHLGDGADEADSLGGSVTASPRVSNVSPAPPRVPDIAGGKLDVDADERDSAARAKKPGESVHSLSASPLSSRRDVGKLRNAGGHRLSSPDPIPPHPAMRLLASDPGVPSGAEEMSIQAGTSKSRSLFRRFFSNSGGASSTTIDSDVAEPSNVAIRGTSPSDATLDASDAKGGAGDVDEQADIGARGAEDVLGAELNCGGSNTCSRSAPGAKSGSFLSLSSLNKSVSQASSTQWADAEEAAYEAEVEETEGEDGRTLWAEAEEADAADEDAVAELRKAFNKRGEERHRPEDVRALPLPNWQTDPQRHLRPGVKGKARSLGDVPLSNGRPCTYPTASAEEEARALGLCDDEENNATAHASTRSGVNKSGIPPLPTRSPTSPVPLHTLARETASVQDQPGEAYTPATGARVLHSSMAQQAKSINGQRVLDSALPTHALHHVPDAAPLVLRRAAPDGAAAPQMAWGTGASPIHEDITELVHFRIRALSSGAVSTRVAVLAVLAPSTPRVGACPPPQDVAVDVEKPLHPATEARIVCATEGNQDASAQALLAAGSSTTPEPGALADSENAPAVSTNVGHGEPARPGALPAAMLGGSGLLAAAAQADGVGLGLPLAAVLSADGAPATSKHLVSLSLCGGAASSSWPPLRASADELEVFVAHCVSRERFEAEPLLLYHPDLRVCIGQSYIFTYTSVAPLLMAHLAFGVSIEADSLPSLSSLLLRGTSPVLSAAAAASGTPSADGSDRLRARRLSGKSGREAGRQTDVAEGSRRRYWFSWGRSTATAKLEGAGPQAESRPAASADTAAREPDVHGAREGDHICSSGQGLVHYEGGKGKEAPAEGSVAINIEDIDDADIPALTRDGLPADRFSSMRALVGGGASVAADSTPPDGRLTPTSLAGGESADGFLSSDLDSSGGIRRRRPLRKTMTPSSEQLHALHLRPGANTICFCVNSAWQGTQMLLCNIYLLSPTAKLVISDVDGTITKSDVLGQMLPRVGVDWSHLGVTALHQV